MRFPHVSPLLGSIAALLFISSAALSFFGLGALARPGDFSARVRAAEEGQEAIAARKTGAVRRFAETATCSQATVPASQALRQTLADLATRHQLTISELQASPASPERALAGLAAIDLQLVASGSQSNALALLANFERISPAVFLDHVELRPKSGAVDLKLSGRAFCTIPARR